MILSAAAYAEDEQRKPPRELELAFDWLHRYLPPWAGGSLDQPYALMRRMRAAYNVWSAMSAWHEARNRVTFVKEHSGEWQIVQEVLRLRKAEKESGNDLDHHCAARQ